MPTFFDDIHPCNRHRANEKRVGSVFRSDQCQCRCWNERKGINRPYGIVIVVIGILKACPVGMLFVRRGDAVEMRVHRRRMIVVRPGMNVLKRRDKECQHQCKTSL